MDLHWNQFDFALNLFMYVRHDCADTKHWLKKDYTVVRNLLEYYNYIRLVMSHILYYIDDINNICAKLCLLYLLLPLVWSRKHVQTLSMQWIFSSFSEHWVTVQSDNCLHCSHITTTKSYQYYWIYCWISRKQINQIKNIFWTRLPRIT